jgi:hypothetical protein
MPWPCALVVAVVLAAPVAAAGNPQAVGADVAPAAAEQGGKPAPVTPPRQREPDVQQDVLTNVDELAGRKVHERSGLLSDWNRSIVEEASFPSRFGDARHL